MMQEPQAQNFEQNLQNFYQTWKVNLNNKIESVRDSNERLAVEYELLITATDLAWSSMLKKYKAVINKLNNLPYFNNFQQTVSYFIPLLSQNPQVSHIIIQSPIFNSLSPDLVRTVFDESALLQNNISYLDPVTEMNIADLLLPILAHDLSRSNFQTFDHVLKYTQNVNHLLGDDTALSIVIKQNIPSVVAKLFDKGADINAPKCHLGLELMQNFHKSTAIIEAYQDQIPDKIWVIGALYVIDADIGEAVNRVVVAPREDGFSIHADNAIKILNILCSRGGYKIASGVFALACSISYDSIPNDWMAEKIISHASFDPNFLTEEGMPYIYMSFANINIMNKIFNLPSINLELTNEGGYGVLHVAVSLISAEHMNYVIGLLLEKGADIEYSTLDGFTPFLLACNKGIVYAAESLAENGADVKAKLFNGASAAHIAAANGSKKMLKFLYDKGVSMDDPVSLVNSNTPAKIALNHGHQEIAEFINSLISGEVLDEGVESLESVIETLDLGVMGGDTGDLKEISEHG